MKRKLLWIGDAGCDSGFAKCTHQTLAGLTDAWDVQVLGLNFLGDSDHGYPYPIKTCWPGGDAFGVGRLPDVLEAFPADLVVIQNDPWNVPAYLDAFPKDGKRPVIVGAMAVDAHNCRGTKMNGLDRAIFWTQFAEDQAREGGFTKPSGIVPLGVDLEMYQPAPKAEARSWVGIPEDMQGFIFGVVNRNQPRKRLDLTIRYFAEFVRQHRVDDAFLFLHVSPTGDVGVDCDQLASYYLGRGSRRVILSNPKTYHGLPEKAMRWLISAMDAGFSTAIGEGWGLPAMEMMACGVPVVLPDHSAYSEWAKDAAYLVPCSSTHVSHAGNAIGQVMDEDAAVRALLNVYSDRSARTSMIARGLKLVRQPQYRWPAISKAFGEQLEIAWQEREPV